MEDRRLFKRTDFPGAQIKIEASRFKSKLWQRPSVHSLINLSCYGLAFSGTLKVEPGQQLTLRIEFPDGQTLPIKGQVLWLKDNPAGDLEVGLQFRAFGSSRPYNPSWVLKILHKLTNSAVKKPV